MPPSARLPRRPPPPEPCAAVPPASTPPPTPAPPPSKEQTPGHAAAPSSSSPSPTASTPSPPSPPPLPLLLQALPALLVRPRPGTVAKTAMRTGTGACRVPGPRQVGASLLALMAQLRRRLRVSAASGDGREGSPGAAAAPRRGGSLKATCRCRIPTNTARGHRVKRDRGWKKNSPDEQLESTTASLSATKAIKGARTKHRKQNTTLAARSGALAFKHVRGSERACSARNPTLSTNGGDQTSLLSTSSPLPCSTPLTLRRFRAAPPPERGRPSTSSAFRQATPVVFPTFPQTTAALPTPPEFPALPAC